MAPWLLQLSRDEKGAWSLVFCLHWRKLGRFLRILIGQTRTCAYLSLFQSGMAQPGTTPKPKRKKPSKSAEGGGDHTADKTPKVKKETDGKKPEKVDEGSEEEEEEEEASKSAKKKAKDPRKVRGLFYASTLFLFLCLLSFSSLFNTHLMYVQPRHQSVYSRIPTVAAALHVERTQILCVLDFHRRRRRNRFARTCGHREKNEQYRELKEEIRE